MLYFKVVENVLGLIQGAEIQFISDKKGFEKLGWFLFTELYNNKDLFEGKVKEVYSQDWDRKISKIKMWIEFSINEKSMLNDGSD